MKRRSTIIGAFVSGLCLYLALSHTASPLIWIALVPLFLVAHSPRESTSPRAWPNPPHFINRRRFLPGFIAGATLSVFAFAWMIPGARAFTGAAIAYGIALFILCVSVFASGCGLLLACCPPPLTVPVWVLAETVLQSAAEKMPWFLLHVGNALASDLYAIQPVSVIGVTGAGFVVISVNYLAALAIRHRSRTYALAPVLLFGCYMAWGWWLLPPAPAAAATPATAPNAPHPSFPLAILTEQIPPEIAWDSSNGNARVQQLLEQEGRCIAAHPRMILWAESAIPWTYSPDDDLVREILQHSRPQSIAHVLGMNTAVSVRVVRNSAYCLLPDGRVAGRYDKTTPLLFVEQPGLGLQFPFFSPDGYSVEPGDSDQPLVTPYGKAGVLICNESALPYAAASRVRQGAQFLLNLSNDGWFRDTWLVGQHFYNARLRAVETRKDMAVNSNNGWSGCIHASGRTEAAGPTDAPNRTDAPTLVFSIHPNDDQPIAVRYPHLPVYGALLLLLTTIIINRKTKIL